MRKILYSALLLFPLLSHADTGDSLNYLTPKDTIFLGVDAFDEKYMEHIIQPKQTLYSLARFYGLSVEELYFYNPGLKDHPVQPGMGIQVPLPNRAIRRYPTGNFTPKEFVPAYYVVKKGDTMYRISKVYFKMPVEDLMERNRLADHTLKMGQCLHVGWLSIHGVPDSLREFSGGPIARRNNAMRKIYQHELADNKEYEHQGAAIWKTDSKEDSDLYALHRYAPINSIISVTNPMSKRVVYVKVIGRIPDTAYKDEVAVVLSPLAAKALAAIDPRFFVRVKYHR
ncbi:MAG: LysM peptidoglycan-binding domain-containing protein [Lewinellaceae bacterium]|nr:LysM peptidoglycan-binding domain-containing protein [Lewinellaceae bacterium]